MRVLITGAAGFIGSHLAQVLSGDHEVIGLDDLSTGDMRNLDGVQLHFVRGSILDIETLERAARGCHSVVHLAARPSVPRSIEDPMSTHYVNTTGTLNVLEVARRLDDPTVIVASSSSVYGSNPAIPKHEALLPMPVSPYAVSKLATEQYALAWKQSYGLKTLPFRFFNVFGPHQAANHAYAAVLPAFISAGLLGQPVPVHGDGLQSRDFTFVGDVVNVIKKSVERRLESDGPINLAFGARITLIEALEVLEEVIGNKLLRAALPTRAGDVRHSQADNSLLRDLLPDITPTDFREALSVTVTWFRQLSER